MPHFQSDIRKLAVPVEMILYGDGQRIGNLRYIGVSGSQDRRSRLQRGKFSPLVDLNDGGLRGGVNAQRGRKVPIPLRGKSAGIAIAAVVAEINHIPVENYQLRLGLRFGLRFRFWFRPYVQPGIRPPRIGLRKKGGRLLRLHHRRFRLQFHRGHVRYRLRRGYVRLQICRGRLRYERRTLRRLLCRVRLRGKLRRRQRSGLGFLRERRRRFLFRRRLNRGRPDRRLHGAGLGRRRIRRMRRKDGLDLLNNPLPFHRTDLLHRIGRRLTQRAAYHRARQQHQRRHGGFLCGQRRQHGLDRSPGGSRTGSGGYARGRQRRIPQAAGGHGGRLLLQEVCQEGQRGNAVELDALLEVGVHAPLNRASGVVQPAFDRPLRAVQDHRDIPNGQTVVVVQQHAHSLRLRQGVDQRHDHPALFFVLQQMLRLITAVQLLQRVQHLLFRLLPVQERQLSIAKLMVAGVGDDPVQPAPESVRRPQRPQAPDHGDQDVLGRILGVGPVFHHSDAVEKDLVLNGQHQLL